MKQKEEKNTETSTSMLNEIKIQQYEIRTLKDCLESYEKFE